MATNVNVRRRNPSGRVRVVIQPGTGKATLSGIPYRILRQILTQAVLHCYAEDRRGKKKAAREYARQMLKWLNHTEEALNAGIKMTHPQSPDRPKTKKERWAKIEESRALERILNVSLSMVASRAVVS